MNGTVDASPVRDCVMVPPAQKQYPQGTPMMGFFRRLFGPDPAAAARRAERGLEHFGRGEYERAVVAWTEAIHIDPANPETYVDRSWAYVLLRRYDEAIADCTAAIRLRPDSEAFNNRGIARAAKGESDLAIADFTEAIRLRPLGVKAYLNRARAHRERGDLDAALADASEAVRLDPGNDDTYRERAPVYRARGDVASAEADEQTARELRGGQ
jgi:tetratricopeptide (TPR) repeat protein